MSHTFVLWKEKTDHVNNYRCAFISGMENKEDISLKVGDWFEVVGLQSAEGKKLNGSLGQIIKPENSDGRFMVMLYKKHVRAFISSIQARTIQERPVPTSIPVATGRWARLYRCGLYRFKGP